MGYSSPEKVRCPLVDDEEIMNYDCVENRDVADEFISEKHLPEIFKKKADWRTICRNCKWHNY
jgi:hypothetical protein